MESCPLVTPSSTSDPLDHEAPRLADALRQASERAAFAIEATLDPGSSARGAGERLGIDKKLAWKLLTFARESMPTAMLQARPGRRGWSILLAAFERAGLDGDRLGALRASVDTLTAVLADPDLEIDLAAFESSRPHRARGAANDRDRRIRTSHAASRSSAVVASDAKITTYLLTRSPRDPRRVDMTVLQLFDRPERQVPGPPLPIANLEQSDAELIAGLPEGTDPNSVFGRRGPLPPLLERASSPGVVGVELGEMAFDDGKTAVGFSQRDPRRAGPLRLAFGERLAAAGPLFADDEGAEGHDEISMGMPVQSWAGVGVLEVLWHRALPSGGPPQASSHVPVVGIPPGGWRHAPQVETISTFGRCDSLALPVSVQGAKVMHRMAVEEALEDLGETYESFEHWRYLVECPSMRSLMLLRWPMARA